MNKDSRITAAMPYMLKNLLDMFATCSECGGIRTYYDKEAREQASGGLDMYEYADSTLVHNFLCCCEEVCRALKNEDLKGAEEMILAYAKDFIDVEEKKSPVKVSVETFVKLYEAETSKFLEMCEQGLDDGNSPINKDMIITWNGITCNVGNGASVSNHVVDGIENFLREDDGVEPKDWEED